MTGRPGSTEVRQKNTRNFSDPSLRESSGAGSRHSPPARTAHRQSSNRLRRRYSKAHTLLRLWLPALLILLSIVLGVIAIRGLLRDRNRQDEYDALARTVHEAEYTPPDPTEQTSPAAEKPPEAKPAPTILRKYISPHLTNSDMIGWIQIAGTAVDYPVMHSPYQPQKYLHLSFDLKKSTPGTPFLDGSCTLESDNYIIYGHQMKDGTMFGTVLEYSKESFFQQHPVIRFDTLYEEAEYEVMAAFYDRVYYSYEDTFKFYEFINADDASAYDEAVRIFKEKSLYETGIYAEYGDQLITLVTCAANDENGRFVVVARKMQENTNY